MAKEKRLNINLNADLHAAFKVAAMAKGRDMTTALIEMIEAYVAKNYPQGLPAGLKKGRRK
jgi:hypothetical protein